MHKRQSVKTVDKIDKKRQNKIKKIKNKKIIYSDRYGKAKRDTFVKRSSDTCQRFMKNTQFYAAK